MGENFMHDNKSAIDLVVAYREGDEEGLEQLIRQYLKPVYGFIYRHVGNSADADDVTQEVFVKMWRKLTSFDINKNFKTWLFAIAKNTAIDHLRKKKTIPFSRFDTAEGHNSLEETLIDSSPLPSQVLENEERAKELERAIKKLPNAYRAVINFRYQDNLTFREIAQRLNEPLDTVKSRHRRALGALKKLLP